MSAVENQNKKYKNYYFDVRVFQSRLSIKIEVTGEFKKKILCEVSRGR